MVVCVKPSSQQIFSSAAAYPWWTQGLGTMISYTICTSLIWSPWVALRSRVEGVLVDLVMEWHILPFLAFWPTWHFSHMLAVRLSTMTFRCGWTQVRQVAEEGAGAPVLMCNGNMRVLHHPHKLKPHEFQSSCSSHHSTAAVSAAGWKNGSGDICQGEGHGKIRGCCSALRASQGSCTGWTLAGRCIWGHMLLCYQELGTARHWCRYKNQLHDLQGKHHSHSTCCKDPDLFPKQAQNQVKEKKKEFALRGGGGQGDPVWVRKGGKKCAVPEEQGKQWSTAGSWFAWRPAEGREGSCCREEARLGWKWGVSASVDVVTQVCCCHPPSSPATDTWAWCTEPLPQVTLAWGCSSLTEL